MPSPAATRRSDSPKSRDDTPRSRCGAAHRDEEFADSAIREYPMEATRCIPWSHGVNVGAVSRGHKVRDRVWLALTVVVLFAASGLPLGPWLLVAGTVALVTSVWIRLGRRGRRVLPHGRGPLVLGAVAGMIARFFVPCRFTCELSANGRYSGRYVPRSSAGGAGRARTSMAKVSTSKES